MGSSSSSSSATNQTTNDNRVSVADGGQGVSGGGDVSVHVVPDEAFELGERALESGDESLAAALAFGETALGKVQGGYERALTETSAALQEARNTEEANLSAQIIKIGIPAAALAYVASQWGK